MTELSKVALQHVRALDAAYTRLERPQAIRALLAAVEEALDSVERDPGSGLPAPRPYPQVARTGVSWKKFGAYWFRYRTKPPLVITGVFHDRANIPGRA